jgi:hypothetical protein
VAQGVGPDFKPQYLKKGKKKKGKIKEISSPYKWEQPELDPIGDPCDSAEGNAGTHGRIEEAKGGSLLAEGCSWHF